MTSCELVVLGSLGSSFDEWNSVILLDLAPAVGRSKMVYVHRQFKKNTLLTKLVSGSFASQPFI